VQTVRDDLSLESEFKGAEFGDRRLNRRLQRIGSSVVAQPGKEFPHVMDEGELEGFYRFLSNEKVDFARILNPHVRATSERIRAAGLALCLHDSSEFKFGGEREGLGRPRKYGDRSFHGHFALALTADGTRTPLGVLGVHRWARTESSPTKLRKEGELSYRDARELPNEQDRWAALVDEAEANTSNAKLIHIMDSEADDYDLLAKLVTDENRFVVRLCYCRRLDAELMGTPPGQHLKGFLASLPTRCTRTIQIARRGRNDAERTRRHGVRQERDARLAFSSASVVLRAPSYPGADVPKTIRANAVYVSEIDPPEDVEPVEWMLLTGEPITWEEDLLAVVDFYRARWVIEEYFKALKTGCAYESRQLGSFRTLEHALAIFIPIAWGMLRLRSLAAHASPERSASTVVTKTQLQVLRSEPRCRLPGRPTARDALLAIARLGGFLPRNGEPGWLVLTRGYVRLLEMERGFRLARKATGDG